MPDPEKPSEKPSPWTPEMVKAIIDGVRPLGERFMALQERKFDHVLNLEKATAEPLRNGGIELLAEFIMHQDLTSWAGLSVFLTGEFVLIGIALQTRILWVSVVGFVLTIVSMGILARSYAYLKKYYSLAKARCNPVDLEIFDIKWIRPRSLADIPAFVYLSLLHAIFLLGWITLAMST